MPSPYVPVSTKLLLEHATCADQILVQRDQYDAPMQRKHTYLLLLTNPAQDWIRLERVTMLGSASNTVIALKPSEEKFYIQPHHLKRLRARQRFCEMYERDPSLMPIFPNNDNIAASAASPPTLPPRFAFKQQARSPMKRKVQRIA